MYRFRKFISVTEFYKYNSIQDFTTFLDTKKGTYVVACKLVADGMESSRYKRLI